jgi:Zn-dependent metalloprotease
MSVHRSSSTRILGVAGALWVLFSPAHALAQPARPATALAIERMSSAAGVETFAEVSGTGLVSFLATVPGAPIPLDQPGSAEERARAFLASYGAAFGAAPGVEMVTRRVSPVDEVGMEHVRFQQTFRGIPVTGGELTVHLRGQGVVAVNATTLAGLEGVATEPTVTAAEARILARDALEQGLGVTGAVLGEPRLELLNRGLLGGRGWATTLSWFIEARKIDLREYLWIDARAGKVALQFSQLTDARDRKIYDGNDPGGGTYGDLPGTLVRSEGGPVVVGPAAADANAAYDFSGDTYDYFQDEHGRDSYDGAGATLISTVRYCPNAGDCPYANAFWNGVQMVYGAGFPAADDVDAHELTHAVTEHTAGLFYYMQSGALNESYSDIFGETVDLLNGAGTDTPGARWQMGEDVPGFGAIRDMEDPTLFGDPGKVSDAEFVCGDDYRIDRGGVHSNSGVPNRAYSLMVDGGPYNGQTVAGIGLVKAGKIEYRALSRYLLSASDFLDNYHALRQSCQDLVGTAGITASDCTEVEKALDAVEMDQTWPCAPTQAAVPAYCPAGQGPELWYYEDFEGAVVGVPDCPPDQVVPYWCVNRATSILGAFATSGTGSLWGYDKPTADTIWFWRNFLEMPPPGARLQFNHSHGFDNVGSTYYDGGHVIVSTNGGVSFDNAVGLISAGDTYGGFLSNCCSNPYGGLTAFVDDSWGYTATQLDLSSLSGSAFGYGFIVATDSSVDEFGWFVDDVRIYTCPTCLANRTLDSGYTGLASHYKASDTITAGDGFTVQTGEDVTLEAGSRVVLGDGFRAVGDLTVIADSGACP